MCVEGGGHGGVDFFFCVGVVVVVSGNVVLGCVVGGVGVVGGMGCCCWCWC